MMRHSSTLFTVFAILLLPIAVGSFSLSSGAVELGYPPHEKPDEMKAEKKVTEQQTVEQILAEQNTVEIKTVETMREEAKTIAKVSVAAVITPTQADGSAWDIGAGADLVLCGAAGCYVSNGLEQDATFYAGSGALRLIKKAGACRDVVKCMFRGVELGKLQTETEKAVQLVDVDYVSHSYFGEVYADGPDQCQNVDVTVMCEKGVHRQTFSLWFIAEDVAQKAGKAGLDYVLFKGLDQQRVEALTQNLGDSRKRLRAAVSEFYRKLLADDEGSKTVPASCLNQPAFLAETFYVMGLADANGRRAELLLKDLVGQLPLSRVAGLIRRTPAFYWAFMDITKQFEAFAGADEFIFKDDEKELQLKPVKIAVSDGEKDLTGTASEKLNLEKHQLIYGWQVKARAKAALEGCR